MKFPFTKLEAVLLLILLVAIVAYLQVVLPQQRYLQEQLSQYESRELKIQNLVKTRLDERSDFKIRMQRAIQRKNDSITLILERFLNLKEDYQLSNAELAQVRKTVGRLSMERDSLQVVSNALDSALIDLNKRYILRENQLQGLQTDKNRLITLLEENNIDPTTGTAQSPANAEGTPVSGPVTEDTDMSARLQTIELDGMKLRPNNRRASRIGSITVRFQVEPEENFSGGSVTVFVAQKHNDEGKYLGPASQQLTLLSGKQIRYLGKQKIFYTDAFDLEGMPKALEFSYPVKDLKAGLQLLEFYMANEKGLQARLIATKGLELK